MAALRGQFKGTEGGSSGNAGAGLKGLAGRGRGRAERGQKQKELAHGTC